MFALKSRGSSQLSCIRLMTVIIPPDVLRISCASQIRLSGEQTESSRVLSSPTVRRWFWFLSASLARRLAINKRHSRSWCVLWKDSIFRRDSTLAMTHRRKSSFDFVWHGRTHPSNGGRRWLETPSWLECRAISGEFTWKSSARECPNWRHGFVLWLIDLRLHRNARRNGERNKWCKRQSSQVVSASTFSSCVANAMRQPFGWPPSVSLRKPNTYYVFAKSNYKENGTVGAARLKKKKRKRNILKRVETNVTKRCRLHGAEWENADCASTHESKQGKNIRTRAILKIEYQCWFGRRHRCRRCRHPNGEWDDEVIIIIKMSCLRPAARI